MSKKSERPASTSEQTWFPLGKSDSWQVLLSQVASRFDREYRGEAFALPELCKLKQFLPSGKLPNLKKISAV